LIPKGLVLQARVHRLDLGDRAAVSLVLENISAVHPRIEHIWVGQGYTGTGTEGIEQHLPWTVEIVRRPPKPRGV